MTEITEEIKELHKNLWTEAEKKIFSEENREKVAELKSRAISEITAFKKEAEKEVRSLIKKGNLKKAEITAEIEKLYQNRAEILESLIEESTHMIDAAKGESEEVGMKLKKKVDSIAKDLKKELSTTFTKIKKKIK